MTLRALLWAAAQTRAMVAIEAADSAGAAALCAVDPPFLPSLAASNVPRVRDQLLRRAAPINSDTRPRATPNAHPLRV